MADQTTRVETREAIKGTLSFVNKDKVTEYHGKVEAIIWSKISMAKWNAIATGVWEVEAG